MDAWQGVDEGWGSRAADFASLSEPGNCREYVAVHHRLRVDARNRPAPRTRRSCTFVSAATEQPSMRIRDAVRAAVTYGRAVDDRPATSHPQL